MPFTFRRLLGAVTLGLAAVAAQVQDFPNKILKLIVPASAGTSTDIVARLMGEGLARELGQPVVVENKTGASGNIAHDFVAKSSASGYMLILTNAGPMSINKVLDSKINFDLVREGAQAVTSVIGGQTDFMIYHPAVAMPKVQAGKLRALGLSSKVPSSAAPGVRPLAEQGFAGFDLIGWWALSAPANLPAPVMSRLVQAGDKVVKSPEFLAKLAGVGIEPFQMTQPDYARFVVTELEKWSRIVQLSGAGVD